jgi:hypothetical protein
VKKSPPRPVDAASESIPTGLWICDAAACDRIIAAVGARYAGNVDHNRLVFELLAAREELLMYFVLDSDSGARERKELFSGILDSAIAFKERLLDARGHKYAAREIASRFEGGHFDVFLSSLDRVIQATTALKGENSRGGWVRLERSPKEWFVGEVLPRVFESNFGRMARVSRPDPSNVSRRHANVADGPYIRFAVAVMREMGIRISPETVARALKNVRAGRERRKRRPTTIGYRHR